MVEIQLKNRRDNGHGIMPSVDPKGPTNSSSSEYFNIHSYHGKASRRSSTLHSTLRRQLINVDDIDDRQRNRTGVTYVNGSPRTERHGHKSWEDSRDGARKVLERRCIWRNHCKVGASAMKRLRQEDWADKSLDINGISEQRDYLLPKDDPVKLSWVIGRQMIS